MSDEWWEENGCVFAIISCLLLWVGFAGLLWLVLVKA